MTEQPPEGLAKAWAAMPDVAFTEIEHFTTDDRTRGLALFEQSGHGPPLLSLTRRT